MAAKHPWLALIGLLILCFAVAGVGGLVTTPSIPNWYAALAKPPWTPPDWIFGPVWSVLYLSMAVAAWLVWRQGDVAVPMTMFGIQLVFNAAWSWLFFGLHSPGAAFIDIVLLWMAILPRRLLSGYVRRWLAFSSCLIWFGSASPLC